MAVLMMILELGGHHMRGNGAPASAATLALGVARAAGIPQRQAEGAVAVFR
jgi:hypothetical protein